MNQDQQAPEAQVAQQAPQPNDTIPIDNLDQFVRVLTGWHADKVAMLRHLLQIPEGTTFEVGEQTVVVEGHVLAGFKFGIELALMQVGTLPFAVELEDAL